MNRCSFCEWIPILPWPIWPLAGQCLLGQNVVVGSMMVLLAWCGSMPRGVYLDPYLRYKCASPRLSAELPVRQVLKKRGDTVAGEDVVHPADGGCGVRRPDGGPAGVVSEALRCAVPCGLYG